MPNTALLPRPLRTWLRDLLRLRYQLEKHPVPALTDSEKREHLISWVRRLGFQVFVETGTFHGDTAAALSPHVRRCVTIEIDPELYAMALRKFEGSDTVEPLLGDSGDLIGRVLDRLEEPALFWLDAHYSGKGTGRGREDTPILRELDAILTHRVSGHMVIVDDARDFVGANNYPSIRSLSRFVEDRGYTIRSRNDLILIYARKDV